MYTQFLRLRLHWYFRTSGELLLRHWQWLALACLLVPGQPFIAIFRDAAALLTAAVSPDLDATQHFAVASVINLAAILWILPQRRALSGGAFMRYADTLPVPRGVRLAVDATVLVAANMIMLVAASAAAARLGPYGLCCFIAILILAGIAQHAVLTRRYVAVAGVILGNAVLAAALAARGQWLLPVAAIGVAGAGMPVAARLHRALRTSRSGIGARWGIAVRRIVSRRAPVLLMQSKALAEHPAPTMFRIGAVLALALGADRLMAVFQFDRRALPTCVLAMAAISLLLAGFYRVLSDARRAMASYLAALPLPRHYWPRRDTAFVLLLHGVPLVILLSPQAMRGLLSLLVMFALALTCQVLLALLRYPMVHGGRRSLIYGVLLTALWSSAAIAAVSR